MVDDFDGDAAAGGFGEWSAGVAVERIPGLFVDFYHQKPSPHGGTANARGKEFPLSVLAMLCEVAACPTAKYRSIWQLARTVPMPTCVGDDLMIRSLPGTCRCRRTSVPGTGRLGPATRLGCPSRRNPTPGPSHPRQVAPSVLTLATSRSAARSSRSPRPEAVRQRHPLSAQPSKNRGSGDSESLPAQR